MSDRKLEKYCRIMGWVQAHDPKLASAIQDLCMEGQLSSRFGGVTLLFPDKKVRGEIVTKTYSSDPEEAIDLIRAHIVPVCLKTTSDFGSQTIGSKLEKTIAVKSASGKKVELANGATLEVAKDFKPLRNDKIAVWEVTSGTVPTDGAPYELPRRGKRGGADGYGEPAGWVNRANLAKKCESEFKASMEMPAQAARTDLAYLKRVVSLMKYLASHSECNKDLVRAITVLDRNPVACFYILVEPYKTTGQPYLSHDSINAWIGSGTDAEVDQPAHEMLGLFEQLAHVGKSTASTDGQGELESSKIFNDPSRVYSESRNVARAVIGQTSVNLLNVIGKAYSDALEANQIGGVDAVWPNSVVSALKNSRKLWQDLLRFDLHIIQSHLLHRRGDVDPASLLNTFTSIVQNSFPGNDYWGEVSKRFGANNGVCRRMAPGVEISRLCEFVQSWDFLYCPRKAEFVDKAKFVDPNENPLTRDAWPSDKVSQDGLQAHAAAEAKAAAGKSEVSFMHGFVPLRKSTSSTEGGPAQDTSAAAAAFDANI